MAVKAKMEKRYHFQIEVPVRLRAKCCNCGHTCVIEATLNSDNDRGDNLGHMLLGIGCGERCPECAKTEPDEYHTMRPFQIAEDAVIDLTPYQTDKDWWHWPSSYLY